MSWDHRLVVLAVLAVLHLVAVDLSVAVLPSAVVAVVGVVDIVPVDQPTVAVVLPTAVEVQRFFAVLAAAVACTALAKYKI